MPLHPILLIGGSGVVGRHAARYLRDANPDVPILIGGRDRDKAASVAASISNAEPLTVDLTLADLGLGDRPIGAVAVLFTDQRVAGLGFAQTRGIPYVSISPGINELGPEVARFIHRPDASAVVLGTEWLVGATSVPTLEFAKEFGRVDEIRIGALLDEEDDFGPAAEADLERQTKVMPAALERRDGAFVWRSGDAATGSIRAVDGTELPAQALSPNDLLGLAMATGAPDVRFDLAIGLSSSRRRGEPLSAEIVIELAGTDHRGLPLRARRAVVHPGGQMPLTGLGVALLLERLTGLDGNPPTSPGLYFPYQLLDPAAYLARLRGISGVVLDLDADGDGAPARAGVSA